MWVSRCAPAGSTDGAALRRTVLVVLAALLVLGGGGVIWWSMSGEDPVAAPVPRQTFAVSEPTPDGTRTATVTPIPDDSSSTSAATSTSAPTPSSELVMSPDDMGPDRIYVPSLGVYASLTSVRFSGGDLTIPREPWRVGLDIDSSPITATVGTTLLAGHVDLSGTPGALVQLAQAEPGALVYVTDGEGVRRSFVTSSLQRYSKVSLPRSIFAVDGPRQLVVVTCGGPVISIDGERHYRDNVVLTAVPTSA